MDKQIREILGQYLSEGQISEVEGKLFDAHCIMYHSELPRITQQAVMHIDCTPDDDYPLRILRVYRQHCDCQWAEDTEGRETENPLLKMMNEANDKRARILNKAITKLEKEAK